MRAAALAMLFGCLTPGTSWAEDYLVNDAGAFSAAVKSAKPGDRIVLRDGEWHDFDAILVGRGTAQRPITLTAQTPGKVVITGASRLRLAGAFLVVSDLVFRDGSTPGDEVVAFRRDSNAFASNSRVTRIVIERYNSANPAKVEHWVTLYGQTNRVDHSYFAGKINEGVTLAVIRREGYPLDNRHQIDHNYFGHRPPLGRNGGETIRIGTSEQSLSNSNTIVERNLFDRCDGEAEIISIKSGGNVVRDNTVIQSKGAFVLRHGNGNLIERNIFFGRNQRDTGGVRVINRGQTVRFNYMEGLAGTDMKSALTVMNGMRDSPLNGYHRVANATISNNSVLSSASILLGEAADSLRTEAPVGSRFENNLIAGVSLKSALHTAGDLSGIRFAGNRAHSDAAPRAGIDLQPVKLSRAPNGLLYPTDPALRAVGAPRDLLPVRRNEVGPPWYAPEWQRAGPEK